MGEIYEERGATFAFHPTWAMNFTEGSNKLIFDYKVIEEIKVLFLVTHLRWNGFPVSAVNELYESKIGSVDTLIDLDIKHSNLNASSKFKTMLSNLNIIGWLTTMEGNPPLEIFLLKDGLKNIKKVGNLIEREELRDFENSLRKINIQPSPLFMSKSEANIQKEYDYLLNFYKRQVESFYGLFDIFFTKNCF